MTTNTRELMERTYIRHEVSAYYILLDERPVGEAPVQRRVQKGFDVNLYGSPASGELPLDGEYEHLRSTLEDLRTVAEQILPKSTNVSHVEIMPFDDSLELDPTRHFMPEIMLRIRISHIGNLDQSSGPAEEQLLGEIMEKLEALRNGTSAS